MSKLGALQELMLRLSKTPTSAVARLAATKKVEPLTPQEIERIANAEVILRRKHTGDLLGEKRRMTNVHESRKTAAAAGPDFSREVRGKTEPEMFGGTDVNYGYLTEDPLSTTKRPLMIHYPKKGADVLTPDDVLTQYGQYGFRLSPQGRARTTFTLGDSLDAGRGPFTTAGDLIKPPGPWHDLAMDDSQLYQLAKAYDDKRTAIFETLNKGKEWYLRPDPLELDEWMKREGFSGSFKDFLRDRAGVEGLGAQYPRMVPRPLSDPGALPLLPTERYGLDVSNKGEGIDALLKRDRPGMQTGYLEAQVLGGVGPGDVDRLYDFGYEPSLALEKKARKFGLDYVPMPEDNLYNLVQRAQPKTMGELADLLGPDRFDEWRYYTADTGPQRNPKMLWEAREREVPKFGRGFEKGGSVKNFKPQTRAPKGALCACGDQLGPHFLAADGGSVPEMSRAPWAPQPGFTDPTWSALLREMVDAAPGYLRKKGDEALRYMANRAAPYYGGQRGVNGAANLKEQLDMAAGALRGATAATVGLPGDLQSLGRGAMAASQGPLATLSAMQEHTLFPKSEELKKGERGFLARGAGTPGEQAGEVLGDFIPLIPPSAVGAGVRAARSGAVRAGKGIEAATERALADPGIRGDLVRKFGPMLAQSPANAVKPRGGNFDPGSLDRWLLDVGAGGLNKSVDTRNWAQKQLANYVRKDLGAPTDPLLAVEREFPSLHLPEETLPGGGQDMAAADVNRMRGVSAEFGAPGRRAMAGIAQKHFSLTDEPMTPWGWYSGANIQDGKAGAQLAAELEEAWPMAAAYPSSADVRSLDDLIQHTDRMIGDTRGPRQEKLREYRAKLEDARATDWRAKRPDDPVYGILNDTLGFDHVLDYLEAATEPGRRFAQNEIPAAAQGAILRGEDQMHPYTADNIRKWRALTDAGLTLDPASLPRLSVADAVRKTAQWNKFMSEQGVADGPLSKGWKVHKEYPGDAGKGMRWVEFGAPEPDFTMPEGHRLEGLGEGRTGWRLLGPDGQAPNSSFGWLGHPMADSVDPIIREGGERVVPYMYNRERQTEALREGLGAEGDAMGHCVGGYCDDVLNRGTKIYSLRDAKGKPHVTIEVRPQQTRKTPADAKWDTLSEDERQDIKKAVGAAMGVPHAGVPDGRLDEFIARIDEELKRRYPELVGATLPPEIVQIKGKGNAAPVDDYLPFVQDFVRSGKWGRVGDLRNTGLTGIKGRYFSQDELRKAYDQAGYSIPFESLGFEYLDQVPAHKMDAADRRMLQALGFEPQQKAHGGTVLAPAGVTLAPGAEGAGFVPRDFDEAIDYAERVWRAHGAL